MSETNEVVILIFHFVGLYLFSLGWLAGRR